MDGARIEIIQDIDGLSEEDAETVKRAAETALQAENRTGDVSIMITDEEQIRTLNREFRETDRVTDVLTFPAWEGEQLVALPDGYLGDIAICLQRAWEQSEEYGHSLKRELAFLTVHGCLHLCGYDHQAPEEEALMRERQRVILNEMGLGI